MTENEAKEYMENEVECIKRASHCDRDCLNCELVKEEEPLLEAFGVAIKALEENQKFHAIGTIEEFKALKEKNEPKAVVKYENGYKCPVCNHWVGFRYGYCDGCGQALDLSE